MMPSNKSVSTAETNSTKARVNLPSNDAHRKTGTAIRRPSVSTVGMVKMRVVKRQLHFRAELIERRFPEVDRLSFGEQQVLLHQVVDQSRDGLPRGTDHVGDGLVGGTDDGHVAVVEDLALVARQVEEEARQPAVDVHRGQRLDAIRGVAQPAAELR